jgi:hypothetical protein
MMEESTKLLNLGEKVQLVLIARIWSELSAVSLAEIIMRVLPKTGAQAIDSLKAITFEKHHYDLIYSMYPDVTKYLVQRHAATLKHAGITDGVVTTENAMLHTVCIVQTVLAIVPENKLARLTRSIFQEAMPQLKDEQFRALAEGFIFGMQTVAKQASPYIPPEPKWVEYDQGLIALTKKFSEVQLAELDMKLDIRIRCDKNILSSFLESVLTSLEYKTEQNDVDFAAIVDKVQKDQLQSIKTHDSVTSYSVMAAFKTKNYSPTQVPSQDRLIRTYVREYTDPYIILPADGTLMRRYALEAAFRGAVAKGEMMDMLTLIPIVNVNAQAQRTGRTALHEAAEYASAQGDRLFFDILLNEGSSPTIRDKSNNSALDLWDFTKNPDAKLSAMFSEYQITEYTRLTEQTAPAPRPGKSGCCVIV